MNHHPLLQLAFFFTLLLSSQGQISSQTIYSQTNELVTVDLYTYLNTMSGELNLQPNGQPYSFINCVTQVKAPVTPTQLASQTIKASGQYRISSTSQVLVQVISLQDKHQLTYQLINLQDGEIQFGNQLSVDLSLDKSVITANGICFNDQNSGYFTEYQIVQVDQKDTTIYSICNFIVDTGLLSSACTPSNSKITNLQIYRWNFNPIIFADVSNTSIGIITTNSTLYTLQASIPNTCYTKSQYILTDSFAFSICGNLMAGFMFTAYLPSGSKSISQTDAFYLNGFFSFDIIPSQNVIDGVVYLTSKSSGEEEMVYFTEVQLNQSFMNLQVVGQGIHSLSKFTNFTQIQNSDLMVTFTDSQIIGYSLKYSSLMFEIDNYQSDGFTLFSVLSAFNVYQLQFVSQATPAQQITVQYSISVPQLIFTQTTNQQIYTITNKYGLEFVLTSNQLASQISSPTEIQLQQTVGSSTSSFSINLDEYFIGSALSFTIPDIVLNPPTLKFQVSSINIIDTKKLDASQIQIKYSSSFYPSQWSNFIISFIDDKNVLNTQIFNINANSTFTIFNKICTSTTIPQILQVDTNALFTYEYTNKKDQIAYYAIALPLSQSFTDICIFPTINTTCQKTNTYLLASDVYNAMIFGLCGTTLNIYTYILKPFSFVLNNPTAPITLPFLPVQMVAISGILYSTDNISIFIYFYKSQIQSSTITIPTTYGTISSVQLFSKSYLLITDQNVYQFLYQGNTYLRNFGLTLPFQIQGINQVFQPIDITDPTDYQEYIVIQIQGQNQLQVYRINQVIAQNQLYKSIPVTSLIATNKLFYSSGYFGYVDFGTIKLATLSYNPILSIAATLNMNNAFSQSINSSIQSKITVNGNNQNQVDLNINFSKDVSSFNAQIDFTEIQVAQLQTYFIGYSSLASKQSISLNLNNAVSSNVMGWVPNMSGISVSFTPIINNLISESIASTNYFDVQQITGQIIAYSQGNTIYIGSTPIQTSTYDNCYLYLDNATITDTTYILYALCYNFNSKQEILKITITLKNGIYDSSNRISFQGQFPFFTNNQVVTKIQSDIKLGVFALVKSSKFDTVADFCILDFSVKDVFSANCNSAAQINSLKILDVVYIPVRGQNVFITLNGFVYAGFSDINSQTTNGLSKIDLSDTPEIVSSIRVSEQLQVAGSLSQNTICISYDKYTIVELNVSEDFVFTISKIFYSEQTLVFSGYGLDISNEQTILLTYELETGTQYMLLFQGYSTGKATSTSNFIVKSSLISLVGQTLLLNRCAKVYLNNNVPYYLANQAVSEKKQIMPPLKQTAITQQTVISLSTRDTTSFDGVAFYLQLAQTTISAFNSIPVSVSINQSGSSTEGQVLSLIALITLIAIW